MKNDAVLKSNKDLNKFLENIDIIEKDLVSFLKKIILKIESLGKKFDPNLTSSYELKLRMKMLKLVLYTRNTVRLYVG